MNLLLNIFAQQTNILIQENVPCVFLLLSD